MNCSRFRELLPRYLLGELGPEELGEFLAHAEECEACRRELEFEMRLDALLRQHPAPGLEEEILEELEKLEAKPSWVELAPLGLALGGLAAALFVFLKIWPQLVLWSMLALR